MIDTFCSSYVDNCHKDASYFSSVNNGLLPDSHLKNDLYLGLVTSFTLAFASILTSVKSQSIHCKEIELITPRRVQVIQEPSLIIFFVMQLYNNFHRRLMLDKTKMRTYPQLCVWVFLDDRFCKLQF